MKLKSCLCYLLWLIPLSSGDNSCALQSDCNKNENIRCGMCVGKPSSQLAECLFPFPAVYKPEKSCEKVKVCENNCGDHGQCNLIAANKIDDVVPSCKCDENFFGRTCQFSATNNLSGLLFRQIEFPFDGVNMPVEAHIRKLYLLCSNLVPKIKPGHQQTLLVGYIEVISADGGHYRRIFIKRNACAKNYWISYTYEIRFRYLPYEAENSNKLLQLGDVVLGYMSSCKITVVMAGITNYEYEFPAFVTYRKANLECIAVVKLSGCGSSKTEVAKIVRRHQVTIVSGVNYMADGRSASTSKLKPDCASRASYKWKLFVNEDQDPDATYKTLYGEQTFSVEAFTLEIGKYRLLLEVTSVQEKSSTNYAYCYFDIEFEPLIAVIDGGSERVVQQPFGVNLTTTQSKDPNMPSHNQGHMKSSWSCVDISGFGKEICDPLQTYPVSNTRFIPPEKLYFDAVLNITLKVWTDHYDDCKTCGTVRPALAHATIIVANTSHEDVSIQCLLNCDVKVVHTKLLYLKLKTRIKTVSDDYVWTYFEEGHEEQSTSNIALQGFPSFMLVVRENSFSAGKTYTIVVKTVKGGLRAKYAFETEEVKFEGSCFVNPKSGIKGFSTFSIRCQNFTTNGSSFLYEFYDKSVKEVEEGRVFSGRMLGTSTDGELLSFRVTRGQVIVYVKDESSLYTQIQLAVELSHWDVNDEVLNEIFKNITEAKDQKDYEKMLDYISIVPEFVSDKTNKSKTLERLLDFITDLPTKTLSDVKVISSTLENILVTLNKPVYLQVELGLMNSVVHVIQKQAKLVSSAVGMDTQLDGMSSDEIKNLAATLLTCLRALLMSKDPRTVGLDEFDLDFATEDKLMSISTSAALVIESILNVLTFLQRPGLAPINITSEDNVYVLWVVKNYYDYNLKNYLSENIAFPVSVSDQFLKEFGNLSQEDLVLRAATLDNIFWWRGSNIKSNLVAVSLKKSSQKGKLNKITFVNNSLDVRMNVNHSLVNTTEISAITFQYPHKMRCSLDSDLAIKVHRLDPVPKSLTTLRFLFPQTNGSLQVLVYRNRRPECDMMKRAVNISEQSTNYTFALVQQDEPSFYYVGIIPGPSFTNEAVRYTFQVKTTVCQHWMLGYWSAEGCKISKTKTTDFEVYCKCDHFSIFAAAFPIPPQEVDPFSDIELFLTVLDNPVVVIFVSIVLLMYLIACLWASWKDRKDKLLRKVIILDDNFPGDRYPYLVAVYTSSRFNAGTTAHVGMKIIGSLATSRAHILASSERSTLRRNDDDWFLIYSSEPLGELRNIHVWHDNSGSGPDWFCDKIVVYDLKDDSDAVFVIDEWLALTLSCFPEANVSAGTISQVKSVKRLFLDNCVLGFRENHTLLSIVFRHPRSVMSRLQKVSVLMCTVTVAMLCSIMFYSARVDRDKYDIGMRDFYICVQSLAICFVATFLVLFAFKKSNRYIYQRHRSTTLYKTGDFQEYDALQNIYQKQNFYATYVRFVAKRLKGQPMRPVNLNTSERYLKKRKVYLVIAWSSCVILIAGCSYLVMLYGLKLGLVKSQMWLSSVFLTVSGELLIVGPLKVLLLSFFLSMAFQKMSETSTHQVYVKDTLHAQSPVEADAYEKLCKKREHSMYAPLRHDVVSKMIQRKEIRGKWLTLIDLVISVSFIIVLGMVMHDLWTAHFNTNKHLISMVTQNHDPRIGSKAFYEVRNVTEMENFLHISLFRSLYVMSWYNKATFGKEGVDRGYWAEDFTHRKVGVERLRQIRVASIECPFKFINVTRRCIPRWDADHEDTQDYSVRWGVAQWQDLNTKNSPWKYTKSSLSTVYTMYRLYGESGTLYHDGGYMVFLGPLRTTAGSTITETISNHWQDQLTRAVFVEFTLFNVNRNLFSQVTVTVEYLTSGNIRLKTEVLSVVGKIKLSVWNVFLVVFIAYYVVRSGVLINRQGLMEFLASPRNKTQVLIVVLGALCIAVAIVHYLSSAAKYDDFVESNQSSFFDFDSFVFYFLRLCSMLSLLFCIAILQSLLILHGGRTLVNYFNTFKLASSCVICIAVIIILFLLLQLHWMFLMYIHSWHSIPEVIIDPKFFVRGQDEDVTTRAFFVAKSLLVSYMSKFFFIVFMHSFRISRSRGMKGSDDFNFKQLILNTFGRRKKT